MDQDSSAAEFERLMLPHLNAAYTLARWLIGNEDDARDAVQEAYLRAYKAFGRYRDENSQGWLLTIVRNTCFSWLRRFESMQDAAVFDEELHSVNTVPITASLQAPDKQLLAQVQYEQVNTALGKLPAPFREVLVLHELQGLSYKVIAEIVDIPIGTVMSRLSRARKHMQQLLTHPGSEENTSCVATKSET